MKKLILVSVIVALCCLGSFASVGPADQNDVAFTYSVEIPKPVEDFKTLQVWIPVASDNLEQKILDMKVSAFGKHTITEESQFGNKILFLDVSKEAKFPLVISLNYKVRRTGALPHFLEDFKDPDHWKTSDYLGINQKIPINGKIAKIAEVQTKGLVTDDDKINRIYRYVTNSMAYNKDGTGWGQGDAIWACDNKRGNCTDFHSLFIGMARSQKIPARFEMGFPIPEEKEGVVPGYHCWARAYSRSRGWVPLDSSEAKQQGKMFEYLGYLPPDRIQFSNGRDIMLEPHQQSARLNYFIYPYIEVDGKKSEAYKKEFSFKRL
jgi:transglutaminase-like putative cysteine protease